ncbi:glycosyltransferase [candidate division KSB1 bacterium]|nr:MAG: glycosyltransferase [candidate division KSB1 bacterium]MBC6946595.1 glycosyltransferase [candidate division KSB1 bacterium]MCE7940190.1 glycosyltransferase [Chlorobi bacterium CHB1]MDL1873859.1 glycosyltransferase family 4 protein [Cytophagia bacterium CHB2]
MEEMGITSFNTSKMKLGILTRGSELNGSSRLRAFQYTKHLQKVGVETRILARDQNPSLLLRSQYVMKAISLAAWADVVLLQKPNQANRLIDLLHAVNPRLVVDFDDAVWALPPGKSGPRAQKVSHEFGARLRYAINRSRFAITGSHYLAEWVRKQCVNCDVTVIPTSVDLNDYEPVPTTNSDDSLTIGWIGSQGNLPDLTQVVSALVQLYKSHGPKLRVISSCRPSLGDLNFDFEPWSAETENEALRRLDIGIMPLVEDERARGRCGFKAIQYMATGLPVIASPVGAACEVIEHGITGYFAATPEQWLARFSELVENKTLRTRMGINGRKRVEKHYSIQSNLSLLLNTFERRLSQS